MQRFVFAIVFSVFFIAFTAGCASSASQSPKAEVSERFTEVEKSKMSEEEKLAIYNKYRDEDDMLVCTRDIVTGSHFRRNNCRTVAERRQEREAAFEALDRAQRSTVTGPEGN